MGHLGRPAIHHGHAVFIVSYNSEGSRIFVGTNGSGAKILDADTGNVLHELPHRGLIVAGGFSPDSENVITVGDDRRVRIWDTKTGKPLASLVHQGPIRVAIYSPDGHRIVTASEDNTTRVWEAKTGLPFGNPLNHGGPVYCSTIGMDGLMILTGGWDKTARFWDASTTKQVGPSLMHIGPVRCVAFNPVRELVVTGSIDGAYTWDFPKAVLGEPERVQTWVEVITGLELDNNAAVHVLDTDTWTRRCSRLRSLGGSPR